MKSSVSLTRIVTSYSMSVQKLLRHLGNIKFTSSKPNVNCSAGSNLSIGQVIYLFIFTKR